MYESYWELESKPFESTSDGRFYYPGESHQGALLKLRYAVENRRNAALLSGAAGLGKTMLIQTLMKQLGDHFSPWAHLVFPEMPSDQLLAYLHDELTGERSSATPTTQQSVERIHHVLQQNVSEGRHAVVVIDEAQVLRETQGLETMRLLLNFESDSQSVMTLILVGQPSLLPTLDRMPQLNSRLAVKCLLKPFSMDETMAYISHRMTSAGATREIFNYSAMEAIHYASKGAPREINRIGDLALLIGFAEECPEIDAAQIETLADELVGIAPE